MQPQLNVIQFLEATCRENNVSTFLSHAPNGGTLIYLSVSETDPMPALMRAAMDVALHREQLGLPVNQDQIKIERNVLVTDKEHAYAWLAKDEFGAVINGGYAESEFQAKEKVAAAFIQYEREKKAAGI